MSIDSNYLSDTEALDLFDQAIRHRNRYAAQLLVYRCAECIRDGKPLPVSIRGTIAEILEEIAVGGDPRKGPLPLTRGKGAPKKKEEPYLFGTSTAMQLVLLHSIALKAGIPDNKAITVLAEVLHSGNPRHFKEAIKKWKLDWQPYVDLLNDSSLEELCDVLDSCDGAAINNLRKARAHKRPPYQIEIAQILSKIDDCN